MKLSVENLDNFPMEMPEFRLGGAPEYVNDPVENPDTSIE